MHSSTATDFGRQSGLKYCTKYSRRNSLPRKGTGHIENQIYTFLAKGWNNQMIVRKKASVDIRELCQYFFHIRVPSIIRSVQNLKQIYQRPPKMLGLEICQIVMEHIATAKNSRILCIKTENNPHNQHIQALEHFLRRILPILLQQHFIHPAYQRTSIKRYFQFPLDSVIAHIHQEIQSMIFPRQILQLQNSRFSIGLSHIINIKLLKITGNTPARIFEIPQSRSIPLQLLERR